MSVAYFSSQEFEGRHPGSQLYWRNAYRFTQDASFGDNTFSDRPDLWLLALSIKEEAKIGDSLSVRKRFTVEEDGLYLGYRVEKAKG